MAERKARKQNSEESNALCTFGRYVSEALAEMEPSMRNLAKYRINNILFQGQMGTSGQYDQQQQIRQNFAAPFPPTNPWLVPNQQGMVSAPSPINTWMIPPQQDSASIPPQQNIGVVTKHHPSYELTDLN